MRKRIGIIIEKICRLTRLAWIVAKHPKRDDSSSWGRGYDWCKKNRHKNHGSCPVRNQRELGHYKYGWHHRLWYSIEAIWWWRLKTGRLKRRKIFRISRWNKDKNKMEVNRKMLSGWKEENHQSGRKKKIQSTKRVIHSKKRPLAQMCLKRERRNTRFVEAFKCCATKDTVMKEGQKKQTLNPKGIVRKRRSRDPKRRR